MKRYRYPETAARKERRMTFLWLPLLFVGFGGLFTLMMFVTAKSNALTQALSYASAMFVLMLVILYFRYRRVSAYWRDYVVEIGNHTIAVRSAGKTLFEKPVKELSFVQRSKSTGAILLGHPGGGISVPLAIDGADNLIETLSRIRSGEWVEDDHIPEPPARDLLAERLQLVLPSAKYDAIAHNVSFFRRHPLNPFPMALGIAIAIVALANLMPWLRQGISLAIPLVLAAFGASLAFPGFLWKIHFNVHLTDGKLTVRSLFCKRTGVIRAIGVNPCHVLTARFRSITIVQRDYLFAFDGRHLIELSGFQDFPEHALDLARDLAVRIKAELVQGPVSVKAVTEGGAKTRGLRPSRRKFRMNWWVPAALIGGGAAGILQRLVPDVCSVVTLCAL